MNIGEERNYQKAMEALGDLGLTEGNQKLAEQYLEPGREEDKSLLLQVEHQDFSRLQRADQNKSKEYVEHLKKRNQMDELGRYVRFTAAVGGATAFEVLVSYGWNLDAIQAFLTSEQAVAIRAEGLFTSQYGFLWGLMKPLLETGKKALLDAVDLCWGGSGSTGPFLCAVYLRLVPPLSPWEEPEERSASGLFKNLFPRKEKKKENRPDVLKAVRTVEESLEAGLGDLFAQGQMPQEGMETLKSFLRDSRPDEPMPEKVLSILAGRQTSSIYIVNLLSGMAFLSIEHTNRALALLRMTAALNLRATLSTCLDVGSHVWFAKHAGYLEASLGLSVRRDYIRWCLENVQKGNSVKEALARMAAKYPEEIRDIMPTIPMKEYSCLMEQVQKGNPRLYRELCASNAGAYRDKMVQELTSWCTDGVQELKAYLMGEGPLEAVLPYTQGWPRMGWYNGDQEWRLISLRGSTEQQLYRRALVMEALRMHGRLFMNHVWNRNNTKLDKEKILAILKLLEEEGLPVRYQLLLLEGIHDCHYTENAKQKFIDECVKALAASQALEKQEDAKGLAREGSAFARLVSVRVLDVHWQKHKDMLLSCTVDSSKQVREALTAIYGSHREWEPELKAMLFSKKGQEREMAVQVLKGWGAEHYQKELEEALQKEKSKKIKTLLAECLGVADEEAAVQAEEQGAEQLAAKLLKGGKKKKVSWAYVTPFSDVHKLDGTLASDDYLQALLVAYADLPLPGVSTDAGKLSACLEPGELSVYMDQLFGKWLEAGAESKKKWVLYAASIHGGERIVPILYHQIQEWPQASRGALAAEAVKALALNGTAEALLLVDQIARKFKFRQVKNAAGTALSYAAEQLHISREELEDRIVPNLGFDEKMEQVFDYGARSFRVYLSPSLELEVFDGSGKKLKSLPAPGKRDEEEKAKAAYEAFKQIKKQLKTVVNNQKLRLEQALSVERLWTAEKWRELFVKNPVMHQFAIGLVWGRYEDGTLMDTFRYMEDGSFNTVDEDEYELPKDGSIGLVHPIELDEESLKAWKEQLSDYEVVQPIEQLERPIYRMAGEELEQTELTRFGGKVLNGLSLSGKLLGMGWYRGSVLDAGGYYNFYREDGSVGVELEFSGAFVGDENEEVTVYEVLFYRTGTVNRGSYVYDRIKEGDQLKLGEVKPRYLSEMVLQIAKATASSQEQLPYPQCRQEK